MNAHEHSREETGRGYTPPAYWCPSCKTPHYVGAPEDRCVDCGHEGSAA